MAGEAKRRRAAADTAAAAGLPPLPPSFRPRKWQARAAAICWTTAKNGLDRALICSCPASGKTLGSLYCAREVIIRLNWGPTIIIVVTPNLAIKSQWIHEAREKLGIDLVPLTDTKRQLEQGQLDFTALTGLVMSYQQAVFNRTTIERLCEHYQVFVILDEVHHTETARGDREGNRWGAAVAQAFARARFKLCTTGTPFREGNNPIAFVDYDDERMAIAVFGYPYQEAIRDGVCRPIEFQLLDGDMEWRDAFGNLVAANFETPLTKRRSKQRLLASISLDGEFLVAMLKAAHQRLMAIRDGDGADARAAGLVVAKDIAHAEQIARALALITGQPPVLVHNQLDDCIELIDRFRDGDDQWIIGVSMISEGVDIPRLRVGAYATNVTAPLYFHQFCGRLARVIDSRDERAFVFMPAAAELEAIALEIEKEKRHALGGEPVTRLPRERLGLSPRQDIIVEESNGKVVKAIFGGKSFLIKLIETHKAEIDKFRGAHPSRHHLTDTEIIQIMIDLGRLPPGEAAD